MQTISQTEINDINTIKRILDQVKISGSERYKLLLSYYSKLPPEENHFLHAVILAEVLINKKTIDNKQFYKYRLTQKQRKDLFRFLISKDILLRRGKSQEILGDYLKSSSVFELSQQEIKELVTVYFDPAVQSSATKKIDKFFIEKERGVSNKLGSADKDTSDPKKLLSSIGTPSAFDPSSLQEDIESSPIVPQVHDRLMTILKLSSSSKQYQQLVNFIKNEVSPFDAKRISFQLKYVDNELQEAFLKNFHLGQRSTNNIFSLLTKIGSGDQGLYEIRSIIKPRLVVRKRIIEIFYKSLSKALKKEDNPGAGAEFNPVIKIINPGNWKKGITADEVRVCLVIFFKLMKDFKLSRIAKLGHRTMQVFTDLIDQGVRMSENNYLDDFVEVFYEKLITNLKKPVVENLDDIQTYYLSLEETVGAISGVKFKVDIKNSLTAAYDKRKSNRELNTSMVNFLINDYRHKNPEGRISINELARFNPADDSNLYSELKGIITSLELVYDDLNHRAVILELGRYRIFLDNQDSELKLFQILKWVGEYVNIGLGSDNFYRELARELYLETYMSIIRFAYNVKKLLSYHKKLPQMDLELFNSHIKDKHWANYKIDYIHRLGFSSKFLEASLQLTYYMLYLHILARKLKFDLVNNTERELVRELRSNNFETLKERVFLPPHEGILPNTWKPVYINEKYGNFTIYYISNPNELRNFVENKYDDVDKVSEAKITATSYVYLLRSDIPSYLFRIDYTFRDWFNFLLGKMASVLYESNKGIIHANEIFFKYIAYLPVLVFSGPAAALTEIVVDMAIEKTLEATLPENEVAQFVGGLFIGGITTVKSTPKANKILRAQELEHISELGELGKRFADDASRLTNRVESQISGAGPGLADDASRLTNRVESQISGAGPGLSDDASRLTHRVESQIDLDKLSAKIDVENIRMQYSGLDFKLVVNSVGEIIRGHRQKIDPVIMNLIENSTPFRRMIADAESVKLVEISDRTLSKSAPHYYQANSMGSKYEIWVWFKGKKQPVKFDGILLDGNGKTWIGESKFTFLDDIEQEVDNLIKLEKTHPEEFYVGDRDPRGSYHFTRLEERLIPQIERYTQIAQQYGFSGVKIKTNTDFMFQTLQQATEHLKVVESLVVSWSWEEFKAFKKLSKSKQKNYVWTRSLDK